MWFDPVLESVAVAVEVDHFGVVDDSVDHGRGDRGIDSPSKGPSGDDPPSEETELRPDGSAPPALKYSGLAP